MASAGIISPVAKVTMSPGTTSSIGISLVIPSRVTEQVFSISSFNAKLAFWERYSWTKVIMTLAKIMIPITITASISPVTKEITINNAKTNTKGSLKAPRIINQAGVGFCASTLFGPYSAKRSAASSSDNPWKDVRISISNSLSVNFASNFNS